MVKERILRDFLKVFVETFKKRFTSPYCRFRDINLRCESTNELTAHFSKREKTVNFSSKIIFLAFEILDYITVTKL